MSISYHSKTRYFFRKKINLKKRFWLWAIAFWWRSSLSWAVPGTCRRIDRSLRPETLRTTSCASLSDPETLSSEKKTAIKKSFSKYRRRNKLHEIKKKKIVLWKWRRHRTRCRMRTFRRKRKSCRTTRGTAGSEKNKWTNESEGLNWKNTLARWSWRMHSRSIDPHVTAISPFSYLKWEHCIFELLKILITHFQLTT